MNNNIIERLERIETKLDELIAALHNYDDGLEMFVEQETNKSLYDEPKRIPPCVGHDEASWNEEEANKRMDIIGQNGNEGIHYVTNEEADEDAEFSDYGMRIAKAVMNDKNNVRVGKDKDNNTQNKRMGGNKKKYNNKYRRQPNTPVTPKKMGVVEHEQFRQPHKH